ncbi:MAG: cyclodeaminase/cyclohydrolase family protein [Armatimonadota bacterium]
MPDFLNGSVQQYLDQLASGAPTPGGGSAAALTGALGAALLCMSARFTVGREKYADFQENAAAVLEEADGIRADLQRLTEEDAEAYARYGAATALPKSTDEEKAARRQAIQDATRASAQVPMEIVRKNFRLLELAGILAENCNPNLVSDVVVATHFALAAFQSGLINVRANLKYLDDAAFVETMEREVNPMAKTAPKMARVALEVTYRVMEIPIEGDFLV